MFGEGIFSGVGGNALAGGAGCVYICHNMLHPVVSKTVLSFMFAVCGLLLFGCASTSYEDGYATHYQIGSNKWIAYYEGSADMGEPLVLDYAINHCAQVVLELGYKYYKVGEIIRGGTTSSHYIPGMESSVMSVDPDGAPVITTRVIAGRTLTSRRDSYAVTIECFHDPVEGALEAQKVWEAFKARESLEANGEPKTTAAQAEAG